MLPKGNQLIAISESICAATPVLSNIKMTDQHLRVSN